MTRRILAALAASSLAVVALTGCGESRQCLAWEPTWVLQPVFNGKTTALVPTQIMTCTRYADETAR